MKNNAIIKATLGDLLDILDARTIVYIYLKRSDNTQEILRPSAKVYEILNSAIYDKYRNYDVIGINKNIHSTSILIEEA